MKAKAFDTGLFKRILTYTKPYKWRYYGVIIFAVSLSIFAALRPYLLKQTVDGYIKTHDKYGLLMYIILMGLVLIMEVFSQFYFVYWANWLGQDIVKDIRTKLFKHILSFRMKYFDLVPVGQLVTRSVSDIESIARIFSQGLFMIISDMMKMLVVLIFMFYMNWKLTWIVIVAMPILVYITRIFQRKMQVAFEEVRTQIANMNSFVQERVTGMKIVQLFNRERIEAENFKEINNKHRVAWIKTILYNSIFFPIADIISSITLGLVVVYVPEEEVIKGIDLSVEAGQTIAIVGSTGAGKSTIINLLNRFYEINSGTIFIDGHNIENYTLASLRKQIAVVLQDVFLFADTIYNNITLQNPEITREQVLDAAKKIGVHDFIMSLPDNYDFDVKERGVMLSSGQRQLIAFLRSYVSNPSILILDEATSSIDTYSEELIQRATETITKGRTSIIIAHRLATIVNADKIVVMDKGLIVEQGTHQELLNKAEGYYKNLYDSQFSVAN